jgi:hypothetical protein
MFLILVAWVVITLARWMGRSRVRVEVEELEGRVRITTSGTNDWLPALDAGLRREFRKEE